MGSILGAAWRVVIKRTRADWLILAAAMLIILLATTLLSAGSIYASAVAISGLHRTLNDSPITEANVEVNARVRSSEFRAFDAAVADVANDAFSVTGGPILRVGRSDSFALPDQPGDEVRNLTIFGFYENIEQHATLVSGAWPGATTDRVQIVVSEATANALGLVVGSEFSVQSRREGDFVVAVRVVGTYAQTDLTDPFWWDDPLDTSGVDEGESFTTFGPLVMNADSFFADVNPLTAEVNWRILPIYENLTVSEVGPFRRDISALEDRVNRAAGSGNRFSVETELDDILREAERSLLVARTGVMILTIQLAVLAGYALVLTAGLLIEQRRVETALLRSRGASSGQIGTMALMEGLVLALPAAIVGPFIAVASLGLLNSYGPLETINLEIDPVITTGAYLLSILSAIACVVALFLPAYFSARSFIEARQARGRQIGRGLAQRAGFDIALLVIAGLAYWQLRRYGAPITESVQGRLGLDPFLVAAPAIGLLAGAVVALRIIPLLARLVERAVGGSRGLVPSLGAWQVARRPARYTRSALLLMLALAIGLFAVSYTSTWTDSQRDQADYQTGSDLRITPDRRVGSAIPVLNLASAYAQVNGVERSMAVSRDTLTVSRSSGTGHLISLDATVAGDIVRFRDDLSDDSLAAMIERLAAGRPTIATIPLPAEPQRIAFDVRIALDPLPEDTPPEFSQEIRPNLNVVMQDARGTLFRVPAGPFPADGESQRLEVDLARDLGDTTATASFPLTIVSFELRMFLPIAITRTGTFDLSSASISPDMTGDAWTQVQLDVGDAGWDTRFDGVTGALEAPTIDDVPVSDGRSLSFGFSTGALSNDLLIPANFIVGPTQSADDSAIPVLVSDSFLITTEASVGDTIQVDVAGGRRPVEIVGTFSAFPTEDPEQAGIVVADDPTLAMARYLDSARIALPDEWWLAVDDSNADVISATLASTPYSSARVADRFGRADLLKADPVALGIIGALSLGFVAAALFASVGFIVSASVSAHERLNEFALLRALGLSPRQLTGWLSLENGLLVIISLVGGTLLGLLMSWLVLPFVTLTQDASAVVPGIIVKIPWGTIVLLEVVTVVSLALVVGLLAILLRRVGLGTVLRLGED